MANDKGGVYLVRYLPPKQAGYGQIVHAISTNYTMTMEAYRSAHPEVFAEPGFYTLMLSADDTVTVQPKDETNG